MKQVPNIFTLLNLVCGCIAIVHTLQNGITIEYRDGAPVLVDMPEKIWLASLFIGIAAVIDFLDGFVARAFNASSVMGKQLDSLADVVSFGVAPAMIIYQFLRLSFAGDEDGLTTSMLLLMPAFIIAAAAAYRLARFNLDVTSSSNFRGVPVPAAGLLIASFPLIYWHSSNAALAGLLINKFFLYAVIFTVSGLMVSRLPLMGMKFNSLAVKENMPRYLLLAGAAIAAVILQWLAVPVIFVLYIILSLVFKNQFDEVPRTGESDAIKKSA